jgi:O-phosphoseryl-tRNA synthetase
LPFDVRRLRELAERDFRLAWEEGGRLVRRSGRVLELRPDGKPNPLFELVQRMRQALVRLGFRETIVPMIVDKREVYRQYGAEAPIILDRVFFLATLERPDIGIGKKKLEEIRNFLPSLDESKLQAVFRRYKLGEVPADDLIETLATELSISELDAERILSIFPELRDLKPVPTDLTLRSHTTAGWFGILAELYLREPLPVQLFHVGPKFRREQRLDETHLYESWTASVVVMAREITLEDGMEIARRIFAEIGHPQAEMKLKRATSRYYAPGTEFEVFLRHPSSGPVEVGDGGLYSPVALANYGIPHPVFNLGIGLERLLMVETGETDIRKLVYPHLYTPAVLSDETMASMVHISQVPLTDVGRRIAEAVLEAARRHADALSPCEFVAFDGEVGGRRVRVRLVEPEPGRKLVGPAGFNEIYVLDGNVVAVPPTGWDENELIRRVREAGVHTGISFMRAFADLVGRRAEIIAETGGAEEIQVKNVKQPSDINVEIDDAARRFITSSGKRVDVRGPFFTTAVVEVL